MEIYIMKIKRLWDLLYKLKINPFPFLCDEVKIYIWGIYASLRPSDAYMHRLSNHHCFR